MVDTVRTRAALEALFADNVSGSISPQDLRDWLISSALRGGWADYNDAATGTTPVNVSAGNNFVYLPNDGAGPFSLNKLVDPDLTDLWNTTTNAFDFSSLDLFDIVNLRLDVDVTTTTSNQTVDLFLEMASGDPIQWEIAFDQKSFKLAGTYKLNPVKFFSIGNNETKNNPAKVKIRSSDNCTVRVNGWLIEVRKY